MEKVIKKYNALFCSTRSVYYKHRFIDCYDVNRNALSCVNNLPSIAHPPCRLWSKLRGVSKAPVSEKKLAYFALDRVRNFGGVLEHPASSLLWLDNTFEGINIVDQYGGFLFPVYQSDFGYFTPKPTILYCCGLTPASMPPVPLSFDSRMFRKFENLTPEQRSRTTDHFFLFLNSIMFRIINS